MLQACAREYVVWAHQAARLTCNRCGHGVLEWQDARDIKIMELAKRVRSINLQLQREKARAAGLEAERDKFKDVAESKVYPTRLKSATSSGSSEAQATAEALHAEKQVRCAPEAGCDRRAATTM